MLSKRGLSAKVGLGFGIVFLLTTAVGAVGWFGVTKLNRQLESYSEWVEIDTVMHATITSSVATLKPDIATYTDSPTRERFDALIETVLHIRENIKSWQDRFGSKEEIRVAADKALLHLEALEASARGFQEMFDNLQLANTFEVVVAMQDANKELVALFSDVMKTIINPAKTTELAAASRVHQQAFQLMLILVCGGLLLGITLSLWIARAITRPIRRAIEALTDEAESGEASSVQFADTNNQLADATAQQSAALEQTAASLEEISSQTRSNTEHAGQAEELMAETSKVLDEVDEIMGELKRSMDQISEKSDDTQKIVKTIDEIAFQTNLLALNAAVEAARAGEAGAGFAVVADEVRNLAMRAAEASHDTAEQITTTVQIIANGAQLVTRTLESFAKANDKSSQTTTLVSEISAASREQLKGIQQLTTVAGEMERTTHWTSASAQEVALASDSLKEQAARIKATVDGLARLIHGGGVKESPTVATRDQAQQSQGTIAGPAPAIAADRDEDYQLLPAGREEETDDLRRN